MIVRRLFYAACVVSMIGTLILGVWFYAASLLIVSVLFVLTLRANRREHERRRRELGR